jgi:hypothetical protein
VRRGKEMKERLGTLLGNNHVAPQQGPRKNTQEIVVFDDYRTPASFLLLRKYHINCT